MGRVAAMLDAMLDAMLPSLPWFGERRKHAGAASVG